MMAVFHTPVLCHTALEWLVTAADGVYVDATLGGGGHSAALLTRLAPGAQVIGIDRDAEAVRAASARMNGAQGFVALQGTFGNLVAMLKAVGIHRIAGLLLDLGVSSRQLDHGPRGFSHRLEAPLDMRMDQTHGSPAADIVNDWDQQALADTLLTWGEEPRAYRLAEAIVRQRPIATTTALAHVVRETVPARHRAKTLARVFQALRIAVNKEMQELEAVLTQAHNIVAVGGRMVAISYHSLEDRRVKRVMRHGNLAGTPVRDLYGHPLTPWKALLQRPVMAAPQEVRRNPRARSAKLRAAARVCIPGSSDTNT